MSEAILEARPLSEALTEGILSEGGADLAAELDEEAPIHVDDELLKAFGADKEGV